jgi:copper homeostasis protein CutC
MLVRIILACSAIFLLARPAAAEDCQQLDLEARQALIHKAPTCDKAMAQFGDCNYGASGDTALGQIVTDRCEADFLEKLSTGQKRSYLQGTKRCNDAVKADEGTLSIAIGAGCRAKLAQDYAHKFGKRP